MSTFNPDYATIAKHFCIALVWADAPEGTSPRVPRETLESADKFAREFITAHPALCEAALSAEGYGDHPDAGSPAAAFGHDLFLTCAGHGISFGDRDALGDIGAQLAAAIHSGADWRKWRIESYFYRGWAYLC